MVTETPCTDEENREMAYSSEEIAQQINEAEAAFSAKAYDKAVALLNDIITHNPNAAVAHRKLGAIFMRTDTPQQALPYLKKAISLAEDDIENWQVLGHYYKKMELWKEMKETFIKVLQIHPDDFQSRYEVVQAVKALGNGEIALKGMKGNPQMPWQ